MDVYVLNAPDDGYKPLVQQFDGDDSAVKATNVQATTDSSISIDIFGNNQQFVLMNADSLNDSSGVSVTLTAIG